jgi:hypothetical protein
MSSYLRGDYLQNIVIRELTICHLKGMALYYNPPEALPLVFSALGAIQRHPNTGPFEYQTNLPVLLGYTILCTKENISFI